MLTWKNPRRCSIDWTRSFSRGGRYRCDLPRDTVYRKYNAVWLIDGETYPKLVGKGGTIFRTPTIMEAASLKRESIGAQELTDVPARIAIWTR